MKNQCYYCQCTDDEMRPYGPNMSWVCFDCATSQRHVDETNRNFLAQLNAVTGPVIIGEETGPRALSKPHQPH